MDYGKFNVDNLSPHVAEGIDGIRMAFHKKIDLILLRLDVKLLRRDTSSTFNQ